MTTPRTLKVASQATGKPSRARKAAPRVLKGRAAAIEADLRPVLELSGRLKPEFEHIFRLYCQTLAMAEKAGDQMENVEAPGANPSEKRVADPSWRGFRDATVLATQLAREYGLTPTSAAAVKVGATPDDQAERLLA